ncbi:MAG: ASPIC/UnbV domain-containing protein, partial [Opitutaceae bacterium]
AAEVYAGSGYYSQSTPACFFGYAHKAPPRRIAVRWPSGRTTEQGFTPGTAVLVLAAPEP